MAHCDTTNWFATGSRVFHVLTARAAKTGSLESSNLKHLAPFGATAVNVSSA